MMMRVWRLKGKGESWVMERVEDKDDDVANKLAKCGASK
jgi:hypothetical protein